MKRFIAVLIMIAAIPTLSDAKPWYQRIFWDKKFTPLLAGSIASSLLATKGIADCRREFGPANCAGGSGPNFALRQSVRGGLTLGANLLSMKLKADKEKGKINIFTSGWFVPSLAATSYNVTDFFRNDPDVARWKGVVDDAHDHLKTVQLK